MIFFQELLFTLGLSFLFYIILVKFHSHRFMQGRYYSWSLQSSVTAVTCSSKNDTSKKRFCYVEDLARTSDQKSKNVVEENPMGDVGIVGTAVLAEKMKRNEQEVSKEEGDTYAKQNVGGDDNGVKEKVSDKSCYVAPKFREFEIGSLYYVEEIPEELEFQEIENNPSEKDGVAKEGAGNLEGENRKKQEADVLMEKSEELLEDWEGIERTDLEKLFGAAVVFVNSKKNDDVLDNELKMQLYGLHKIATEGPCYGPQPMPFKLSARAKWSSWHRLGDMSREKAMKKYVALLSDRVAEWKIDKTDVNYELISRDIETSQDRLHFCAQVSSLR
ncbi:uncharacterized protein LOC107787408 [Nicotiana tabacum]|uniref:uncharacterized protein LOC107787408 n=1 Tax=Nicotiana tabacum TaxID=4097 RepID=UPI003F4ECC2B